MPTAAFGLVRGSRFPITTQASPTSTTTARPAHGWTQRRPESTAITSACKVIRNTTIQSTIASTPSCSASARDLVRGVLRLRKSV